MKQNSSTSKLVYYISATPRAPPMSLDYHYIDLFPSVKQRSDRITLPVCFWKGEAKISVKANPLLSLLNHLNQCDLLRYYLGIVSPLWVTSVFKILITQCFIF